ncbi:MAG: mechanosensitive ion channel domain-containing protein [Bacteroidota bacterium]
MRLQDAPAEEAGFDPATLLDPEVLLSFGISVAKAIVLLILTWIVAGWISKLVRKAFNKANVDVSVSKFVSGIVRYLVLIAGVLVVLDAVGIKATSFIAILGAAGLAVGLALQGTISNFAAGVMLLLFRPFKVGDVVSVGGHTGKVDEISLLSTNLDTPDNRHIIIPNGAIFGSTIENITKRPTRRADVNVGTDYPADLDHVREVLEKAASEVPGMLKEPAPQVYLVALGGSSIDWQVRVWCNTADYFAVKEATTRAVKMALDAADIGIPFPQMDVHLDGLVETKPAS